jgi:nucleotide-binding universal stress UspA family protein
VALKSRPLPPDAPPARGGGVDRGPVMLATFAVPFDGDAARVAVQAAMETSVKLLVVDVVEQPFWPLATMFGHAALELDEDRQRIRDLAAQVSALGLEVEHLRVRSPRPVDALLEVAGERRAALLVLGPDPTRLKPRIFERFARRIRRRASCLIWIAGEGP